MQGLEGLVEVDEEYLSLGVKTGILPGISPQLVHDFPTAALSGYFDRHINKRPLTCANFIVGPFFF